MTLNDLIQHLVLLNHEGKIKAFSATIIDDKLDMHHLIHAPQEFSMILPTAIQLTHAQSLENLVRNRKPINPLT